MNQYSIERSEISDYVSAFQSVRKISHWDLGPEQGKPFTVHQGRIGVHRNVNPRLCESNGVENGQSLRSTESAEWMNQYS